MALPSNADRVVIRGRWQDEITGEGVSGATVSFKPVPLAGQGDTPNLKDLTAFGHIKTRTVTASVNATTGYYAAIVVSSDDPDLDAYGGREVTFSGEASFRIAVPANTPMVTVDAELAAAIPSLTLGSQVRALWLVEAPVVGGTPPAPLASYSTTQQMTSAIAGGIEDHDDDTGAHPDIRALIGQGGGGGGSVPDATSSVKGVSVLMGGTASAPTVPWSKIPDRPSSLPPSGAAGGVLSGTYPSPGFAVDMATQAELDTAIASRAPSVHGHTSSSISDFVEAVQDAVAALLGAGSNVTLNYDDAGNTLTIAAAGGAGGSGLDAEAVRDAIGVALVGVGNVGIVVNDAADTITISTTATVNSTDAALRDRTTHTGEQPQASITGLVAALAAKANANSLDAAALTGTIDDARIPGTITRDSELEARVLAAIAELRGAAPAALDTFIEVSQRFADDAAGAAALAALVAEKAGRLRPTADVKTGNYTAVDRDLVRGDPTGGSFSVQLPAATDGRRIAVKDVRPTSSTSTNTITVLNPDASVAVIIRMPQQTRTLIANGTDWTIESGQDAIPSLDLRYARIPLVVAAPYAATVTPNVDTTDVLNIAALTGPLALANPSGTPRDGQNLRVRLVQDSTGGRAVTLGTAYAAGTDVTVAMIPTTANAKCELLFTWNAADAKFRFMSLVRGF